MKREGTFLFENYNEEKDSVGYYSYDDAWFDESSFLLNKKLRTMSLCFSMASFPSASKDAVRPSINAEMLLSELSFNDIEVNDDFLKEPGVFSLGLVAAQKKIGTRIRFRTGPPGNGRPCSWRPRQRTHPL